MRNVEVFTYDEIPTLGLLTAADRCDVRSCGAQAYVSVGFWPDGGEPTTLVFCAHHFVQHEHALRAKATHIFDERSKLAPHGAPVTA